MLAIIRQMFLKGKTIKDAIFYVFEQTGNMPTKSLGKKIIDIYKDVQDNTAKIIKFPEDRITPFYKPRPGEGVANTKQRIFKIDDELEKISAGEGKYAKMSRDERENLMIKLQDESSTLQGTPGMAKSKFDDEFLSFKLNIAKNNPEFNQDLAKQVINREMFKDATTEQRKQVLDALDFVLKNPQGMASGGLAREKFGRGYLAGGARSLGKKYKGSTLQAILENPRLLGAELGHDGIASILSLFGFSEGGRARVGMYAGGIPKGLMAAMKFLQKKFGKKALYKGDEVVIDNKIFKRSNKKRQMTADELEDFEMDIGDALEGYDFDGTVGSAERILKEQKAYEAAMYRDYKAGRLDPKPGEPNRKRFLEKKLEEMEMSGDKKLMTREEIEELSSFDLGTEMDEAIKKFKTLTPEDELRRDFPGIDDNMIKNILADKNPQRIAEVKQTMREALKMQEKGMSPDEIIKLFKDTTRTKQASGGLAHILGV